MELETIIILGFALLGIIFFWWVIRKAKEEMGKKK